MKNSPSVPSRGRYRFRLHETRISIVLPTTTSFRFLPSYSAFLTGDGARCNNEVNAFLAANGFSKPRGGLGACPGYIFNFTSRLFFALLFFLSYRDASFLPSLLSFPRHLFRTCLLDAAKRLHRPKLCRNPPT